MTLTEMYSEYIQKSAEVERLSVESQQKDQVLDQVLTDIREKAPLIAKQREEYQKAEGTRLKNNSCSIKIEGLKSKCYIFNRRIKASSMI